MSEYIHPFEKAGLGRAPYGLVGVTKQSSSCQYCSTAILYQFHLKSADGLRFYVGSDCIAKSGDSALTVAADREVKARQRERRSELKREKAVSRKAAWEAERQARVTSKRNEYLSVPGNSELIEAIRSKAASNKFMASLLLDGFERFGSLTEGQQKAAIRVLGQLSAPSVESAYVGEVGARIELTITTNRVIVLGDSLYNPFASYCLYLCRDSEGNSIVYKGTGDTLPDTGQTKRVRVTIKKHALYEGVKQTTIEKPHAIEKAA